MARSTTHRTSRDYELVLQGQRLGVGPDRQGPAVLLRDVRSARLPTRRTSTPPRPTHTKATNDFWGAKFDWHINDNHLLEAARFLRLGRLDHADLRLQFRAPMTFGAASGDSDPRAPAATTGRSPIPAISATTSSPRRMYGVNERSALGRSPWDADCSSVASAPIRRSACAGRAGCHPTNTRVSNR